MKGTQIQGGQLRGQSLGALPRHIFARPILARIKKSLFDILKYRLTDCRFLDLFSGSGNVGLEALSRGARQVTFVDKNPEAVRWIQKSIARLESKNPDFFRAKQLEVRRADVLGGLAWTGGSFDLIFSGAPYVNEKKEPLYFINGLLEMIERDAALSRDGWFIAQHHAKEPFQAPPAWDFFRQQHYGDSAVSFFRYARGD